MFIISILPSPFTNVLGSAMAAQNKNIVKHSTDVAVEKVGLAVR